MIQSPTAVRDAVAQLTQGSDPLAVKSALQTLTDLCRSDQTNASRMTAAGVVEAAARVVDTSNDASAVQAALLLLEHMSVDPAACARIAQHTVTPRLLSPPPATSQVPNGGAPVEKAIPAEPVDLERLVAVEMHGADIMHALDTLLDIAFDQENVPRLVDAGVVEVAAHAIETSANASVKPAALLLLARLAVDPAACARILTTNAAEQCTAVVFSASKDPNVALALVILVNLLRSERPHSDQAAAKGDEDHSSLADRLAARGGIEQLLARLNSNTSSPADSVYEIQLLSALIVGTSASQSTVDNCVVAVVRLLRLGTAPVKLAAAEATLVLIRDSPANAATALRMLVHETFLWLMGSDIELATVNVLIIKLMNELRSLNMREALDAAKWTLKSLTDKALLNSVKRGPAAFHVLRDLFQGPRFIDTAIEVGALGAFNTVIERAVRERELENSRPFLHCIALVKCIADSEHCPKLASSGIAANLTALKLASTAASTLASVSMVLDTIALKTPTQQGDASQVALQSLEPISADPNSFTRVAQPNVIAACITALHSGDPEQIRLALTILTNVLEPNDTGRRRLGGGSLEALVAATREGAPALKYAAAMATVAMLKGSKPNAVIALQLGVHEAFLSLLHLTVGTKIISMLILKMLKALHALATPDATKAINWVVHTLIEVTFTDPDRRASAAFDVLRELLRLEKFAETAMEVGLLDKSTSAVEKAIREKELMKSRAFQVSLELLKCIATFDTCAGRVEKDTVPTLTACLQVATEPSTRIDLVELLATVALSRNGESELLASSEVLSVLWT